MNCKKVSHNYLFSKFDVRLNAGLVRNMPKRCINATLAHRSVIRRRRPSTIQEITFAKVLRGTFPFQKGAKKCILDGARPFGFIEQANNLIQVPF